MFGVKRCVKHNKYKVLTLLRKQKYSLFPFTFFNTLHYVEYRFYDFQFYLLFNNPHYIHWLFQLQVGFQSNGRKTYSACIVHYQFQRGFAIRIYLVHIGNVFIMHPAKQTKRQRMKHKIIHRTGMGVNNFTNHYLYTIGTCCYKYNIHKPDTFKISVSCSRFYYIIFCHRVYY